MYRLSDDIRLAADGDGGILLDIQSGNLLRLNSTGVLIVNAIREGEHETEIVSRIAAAFTAPKEAVLSDLRTFVDSLEQLRLIHREDHS